jgi:NCAIR mutase (PurE)-related protein
MKTPKVKRFCSECKILLDAGNKSAMEGLCLSCAKKALMLDTAQKQTKAKKREKDGIQPPQRTKTGENGSKPCIHKTKKKSKNVDSVYTNTDPLNNNNSTIITSRIHNDLYELLLIKAGELSISELIRSLIIEHISSE